MAITYPAEQQWPPKPYDRATKDMQRYQAWYSGDVDELTNIYSSAENRQRISTVTGSISYDSDIFFWGRPNDQGTKRRHVPTPANIARAASDLLFSQPPKIMPGPADEDNAGFAERMDTIFSEDTFAGTLSEGAETASVLGGVYLVPWWDEDIADHIMPGIRDADTAIPEWSYDRLRAVTFYTLLSDIGETPVVRHLERHEKGKITHAVYSGTSSALGEKIDLADHPATEWAADSVNEDGEIETQLDRMHVVYVPNVKPARLWRKDPLLNRLGRSDFEGIESEFDALDEVHTSWVRDVEDAKSRVFVDESLLDDDGPGKGGRYDQDKQVYVRTRRGAGGQGLDAKPLLESVQFSIRWQEHAQTKAEILQHVLQNVGISAQQFTDGALAIGVTATEINTRNTISENTRQKKLNYWQSGLVEFVDIVMRLDAIHFNTGIVPNDRPIVQFPSKAVQSEKEQAEVISSKRSANVISVETAVRTLNPDWTETEVNDEVDRIRADQRLETQLAYGDTGEEGEEELPDEGIGEDLDPDTGDPVDTLEDQIANGETVAPEEGE